jgi:hypothetical protein
MCMADYCGPANVYGGPQTQLLSLYARLYSGPLMRMTDHRDNCYLCILDHTTDY